MAVAIAACLCALATGCGYLVGNAYQAEIRTVHVPIFKSDSNRRDIEFMLTEAVQKEIQNRSTFRLAKEGEADSELRGRIVEIRKAVLGESAFDDPRELQMSYAVEVTWVDARNGEVLSQQRVPIAPDVTQLLATSDFSPEVGHSLATAHHQGVKGMARKIVDMMEAPW